MKNDQPVSLKIFVDPEWLEPMIEFDFIDNVESYDDLMEKLLRAYFNEKAQESRELLAIESNTRIVENELRMYMRDTDARFCVENLFESYVMIFGRQGLSCVLKNNQRVAANHVCSIVRPV